jgi:hypothetical protein
MVALAWAHMVFSLLFEGKARLGRPKLSFVQAYPGAAELAAPQRTEDDDASHKQKSRN